MPLASLALEHTADRNSPSEDRHVLVSTTASKAALRTIADEITTEFDHVAYFPSYEIITGPHARGRFFAPDLRDVTPEGVQHVMALFTRHFLKGEAAPQPPAATQTTPRPAPVMSAADLERFISLARVVCDEEALDEPSKRRHEKDDERGSQEYQRSQLSDRSRSRRSHGTRIRPTSRDRPFRRPPSTRTHVLYSRPYRRSQPPGPLINIGGPGATSAQRSNIDHPARLGPRKRTASAIPGHIDANYLSPLIYIHDIRRTRVRS
jgi:hypothetical protein